MAGVIKKRVTKDFETRSESDLKKIGAYKYSLHPSTVPTCLAFKLHGQERVYLLKFDTVNRPWEKQDLQLKTLWMTLIESKYEFSAHNSFFERCIYDNILVKRYGWPAIPPRLRRCTAAKAASCALPRSLGNANDAMKLSIRKDFKGYQAMMQICKPTKSWNNWNKVQEKIKAGIPLKPREEKKRGIPEPSRFLEYKDDPVTWETMYAYCKVDVRAEEKLDDALPDLSEEELEIWHLNQEMNWRGLRIDIPTVKKIVQIMEHESKKKLTELDTLTMGLVTKPGSRKSILEFLALEGIELPDLKAKTVDDALGGVLPEDMKRLLEIRKALSLTSTKKYQSFLDRASDDDRVRDITMYHGASTGRETGTGIQPHNFPKPLIKQTDIEYVIGMLNE